MNTAVLARIDTCIREVEIQMTDVISGMGDKAKQYAHPNNRQMLTDVLTIGTIRLTDINYLLKTLRTCYVNAVWDEKFVTEFLDTEYVAWCQQMRLVEKALLIIVRKHTSTVPH